MKTIKLTQGKHAIVDNEDFDRINKSRWYANNIHGYWRAVRNIRFEGKQTALLMARYVMNITNPKIFIDHINHNTLDNRRSNLRFCNNTENCQNRRIQKDNLSGFKGITYSKLHKKWSSEIKVFGKRIFLGYYKSPKLAHTAYCKAALKYFGEFAHF